jgi:sugar lactone lactonase YvrE
MTLIRISRLVSLAVLLGLVGGAVAAESDWPPVLPGANAGTATLRSRLFLAIPDNVQEARSKEGAADFVMAKSLSTLELAYHGDLGPDAANRRLWSCWGDICLASDRKVYVGIGDHGDDAGGDARCFLYQWDPATKVLKQVVDVNSLLPRTQPHSRWSKMHAKIDEGPDGMIYFSATLNDGNRAGKENFHWSEQTPGGQLYRYDPKTGKAEIFASLPAKRCTATSLLDRERNLWWCNLEAGEGGALFALDLATRKPIFQAKDGSMGFNRNFALARDGAIYFNGADALWKYDPKTNDITRLKSTWGDSPGMRCSTAETKQGEIYGITHKTTLLFRYRPASDELTLLGPSWLSGSYTAVCVLSPDERFVYYLPGAHGGAFKDGTPVVQYEIATGQRKVLAFLAAACEKELNYVPAGTYGIKISADGGTLYVNFNGHPADAIRPANIKPIGFGLTAFAAIQIPPSER